MHEPQHSAIRLVLAVPVVPVALMAAAEVLQRFMRGQPRRPQARTAQRLVTDGFEDGHDGELGERPRVPGEFDDLVYAPGDGALLNGDEVETREGAGEGDHVGGHPVTTRRCFAVCLPGTVAYRCLAQPADRYEPYR